MKNVLSLVFIFFSIHFSYSQNCESYGSAQIDLDVNNVKARLLNSGDLWWDGSYGKYIVPEAPVEESEVSAIFAGAFWMGGIDPFGNLKVAAQRYRQGGNSDFYPGPLRNGLSPNSDDCTNWDRFFSIRRSIVNSHIEDFELDGIIDEKYSSIYGWPGRNNIHFSSIYGYELPEDHSLAPFYDEDQDGDYNPDKGDYPLMKGQQSIWWVFNDYGSHNVTNSQMLAAEVTVMAYAQADENIHINNASYYDVKVSNRGTDQILNSYFGLWTDFDLGCPSDDYIGYDVENQMMYAYNQDATDGTSGSSCEGGVNTYSTSVPIIGIKQFDNPQYPVSSFIAYNDFIGQGPVNAIEYYNLLSGKWTDGAPLTYGGNGYDPSSIDSVSYLYSGNPSVDGNWSLCEENPGAINMKCLMSTSLGTIEPGQSIRSTYAVVFVENVDYPCPNIDILQEASIDVCFANLIPTNTKEKAKDVSFYPNPVSNTLIIKSDIEMFKIQVLNIQGSLVDDVEVANKKEMYLNVNKLNTGMYLARIFYSDNESELLKFVVER